ncbi:Holliday junction DNA helicase RuvA [Aedoeadaptatus coxii]|uniref:Holliday junction branch migration complex subunit RuvA n=1 Tax=Aedoeadaptatus coxii TaxID=755172 RepID=A0A134ABV4_9FIRM|nr:Holliday junction branch migration protein RuvA [Peptoniphilus coxii]KXB65020.1 Holliday junction DNA helicase RuvA [Peptoniphilus coxii]
MIDRIIGKVVDKRSDHIVVQAGGLGYAVYLPIIGISRVPLGEDVLLYTHLQVRDDGFMLYGFNNEKDRELFHLLITVSGVGPKVAIGILSGYESESIISFIRNEDVRSLMKAPGIGKKTAERILLELKDKVDGFEVSGELEAAAPLATTSAQDEAYDALMSLGYSANEAKSAVSEAEGDEVEEILKSALKKLSINR